MCGFICSHGVENKDLNEVIESINYRGLPDLKGSYQDENFQFAHYSLPFVNLDPEVAIQPKMLDGLTPHMFVGEIFNYKELGAKDELDLLQRTLDEDGLNGFHKFDGFWSYATIYHGQILAVTDYLSQKPIYYRTDEDVVASEINILKEFGPVTRNETFHSNVLKWGYDPRPETPWNEIKQVPPGCYYLGGMIYPYWDWSQVETTTLLKDLTEATHLRMGGQREVALLLSGGLDSSIIYGLLKEAGKDVTLVHVENKESEWAEVAFSFWGSNDKCVNVKLDDISDIESISIHQTPVDLGSVKPQIAMARALKKEGIHAVMSGDGADELFGGYRRAKEYDSQHSDIFMEIPYYHAPKLDRTMMASTVELRAPFLSPKVIAHALAVPYEQRNGEKKVLKDVFGYLVPSGIVNREKRPLKTDSIAQTPMQNRLDNEKRWKVLYGQK